MHPKALTGGQTLTELRHWLRTSTLHVPQVLIYRTSGLFNANQNAADGEQSPIVISPLLVKDAWSSA